MKRFESVWRPQEVIDLTDSYQCHCPLYMHANTLLVPGESLRVVNCLKELDMENENKFDLPESTVDTEQQARLQEESDDAVEIITVVKSCAYDPLTRL